MILVLWQIPPNFQNSTTILSSPVKDKYAHTHKFLKRDLLNPLGCDRCTTDDYQISIVFLKIDISTETLTSNFFKSISKLSLYYMWKWTISNQGNIYSYCYKQRIKINCFKYYERISFRSFESKLLRWGNLIIFVFYLNLNLVTLKSSGVDIHEYNCILREG